MEPLQISPKQRAFLREADAPINLMHGSVRSSKTWGSLIKWVDYCINGPQDADLLLVGKTLGTIERNVLPVLRYLLGPDLRYIKGTNPHLRLWGRDHALVGANDASSFQRIQGLTAAGIYGDEITTWPESFFNMALSRVVSIAGAQVFGTCNPDGPGHWLKKNWIDKGAEKGVKSFQFLIDDNPFLPRESVELLKRQYVGLWHKRYILGEWCLAEGAVYDTFDEKIHIITQPPAPAQWYGVGMDYGTHNPTCFILFGVNPNVRPYVWAEREYYWDSVTHNRQKTNSEYAYDLRQFLGNIKPRWLVIDPSAAAFILELKRSGFLQIKEADNDVLGGIQTVSRLLACGDYKVLAACKQYVEDFSNYLWDEKRAVKIGEDKPIKQHDHTHDAARYFLHTLFGRAATVPTQNWIY